MGLDGEQKRHPIAHAREAHAVEDGGYLLSTHRRKGGLSEWRLHSKAAFVCLQSLPSR